jgi:hypothetical protein
MNMMKEQYNSTCNLSEMCNELNQPLLDDNTNYSDVEKQNEQEDDKNHADKDGHEDKIQTKSTFHIGFWVGLLIFPNTITVQMALAVLNYHIYQDHILTNTQIQQVVLHIAISCFIVTALMMFVLPTKLIQEQRQKILCCNNRLSLLAGLLFGNIVGIFPTIVIFKTGTTDLLYTEFFKEMIIVTLFASSVFSTVIAMSYQYIPCNDEDSCDSKTDGNKTAKLIAV